MVSVRSHTIFCRKILLIFFLLLKIAAYLRSNNLLHTLPLSALKETRLGIDLNLYLQTLFASPNTSEPLVTALGGSPLCLNSHIESDLRVLERAKIKPVFVLSGLQPPRRSRPFAYDDPRVEERRMAWDCYEAGDVDGTHMHLSKSNSMQVADVVRSVLRAFRHRNVEFIVAPYLAEGQVSSTIYQQIEGLFLTEYRSLLARLYGTTLQIIYSLHVWFDGYILV